MAFMPGDKLWTWGPTGRLRLESGKIYYREFRGPQRTVHSLFRCRGSTKVTGRIVQPVTYLADDKRKPRTHVENFYTRLMLEKSERVIRDVSCRSVTIPVALDELSAYVHLPNKYPEWDKTWREMS